MVHPKAKLTQFGRRLIVDRVLVLGWTAAQTAAATGISRATVYKWIRRFKEEGELGLADRSSRPLHSPHALPTAEINGSSRHVAAGSWGHIGWHPGCSGRARPSTAFSDAIS